MPTTAINLRLEPGQKVTLLPVSWQGFEEILAQLGERQSSRIAYANGVLELVAPLPEHEARGLPSLAISAPTPKITGIKQASNYTYYCSYR